MQGKLSNSVRAFLPFFSESEKGQKAWLYSKPLCERHHCGPSSEACHGVCSVEDSSFLRPKFSHHLIDPRWKVFLFLHYIRRSERRSSPSLTHQPVDIVRPIVSIQHPAGRSTEPQFGGSHPPSLSTDAMVWDQLEPTPPHLSYLLISSFLIVYCLFATFIRNRLHLSEPPLALLVGILLGPRVLGWLNPNYCSQQGCSGDENERWGWGDNQIQEISRVILGVQVFTVGVGLPKYYASKHWKSVGILLSKSSRSSFQLDITTHMHLSSRHDIRLVRQRPLCRIDVQSRYRNCTCYCSLPYPHRSCLVLFHSLKQSIQHQGTEAYQGHAVCRVRLQRWNIIPVSPLQHELEPLLIIITGSSMLDSTHSLTQIPRKQSKTTSLSLFFGNVLWVSSLA